MERSRPSPWRSWTTVGALRQTGTKMAAVAEERTSRSLGDCVMAARAGVSRGPTRWTSCEARTPLASLPLHSPFSSSSPPPLLLCTLRDPSFSSSLFFSRGLVFILATTGTTNANRASEGYEARRSEQVRYRLTWNLISTKCHRPRVGKQRSRRFPEPNSVPRNGIPKINEMSPHDMPFTPTHYALFAATAIIALEFSARWREIWFLISSDIQVLTNEIRLLDGIYNPYISNVWNDVYL